MQTLPGALTFVLSLVALSLPGILEADHFPKWVNGLIALFVVAIFSFLSALTSGVFKDNLEANWLIFITVYSALMAGPAKPISDWLRSNFLLPGMSSPEPQNGNNLEA